MSRCKGVTNAGKPCRSRASADGFCGGHSPAARKKITGRPPRPLPAPVADLASRYNAGETVGEIAASIGVKEEFLWHRLRNAGVKMRRVGARFGHGGNRRHDISTADLVERWDEGRTQEEISAEFGISRAAVYKRLWEAFGDPQTRRLRRLYVDEELPLDAVARQLQVGTQTVRGRLEKVGIAIRERGTASKKREMVAGRGSLRSVQRATVARRAKRTGDAQLDRLTERQRDLLDILRAAPEPISTGRVSAVAHLIPRKWQDASTPSLHSSLRTLEKRGLCEAIPIIKTDLGGRGQKATLWFPATDQVAGAKSQEDAGRLRELQVLIEQQETDEQRGDWAENTGALSLDASRNEDGFTILDTLGDEDEQLADLMEEYA